MKPPHNTPKSFPDIQGEAELRALWQNRRQVQGPTPETLDQITQHIRDAAAQHAKTKAPRILTIWLHPWQPIVATAACILILLAAGFLLHNQTTAREQRWHELDQVESTITQELDALEASVWDALAELEEDAPTNELMLQALALQMIIGEGH